jgi:hypothetical protein
VLRCVGFTRLYETGRVEAPVKGGVQKGGVADDSDTLLSSVTTLNTVVGTLKIRMSLLEWKNGVSSCTAVGKVFVATLTGKRIPLKLDACDTILQVKGKIQKAEGVQARSFHL